MREIKFRAWHEDKMVFNVGITCETKKGYFYKNPEPSEDCKYVPFDSVMQFTGLMDKNGSEVYEGDIVKQTTGNYVVEYHEGAASFIFTKDPDDIDAPSFRTSNDREQRKLEAAGLEVIGNIYENADLLSGAPQCMQSETHRLKL